MAADQTPTLWACETRFQTRMADPTKLIEIADDIFKNPNDYELVRFRVNHWKILSNRPLKTEELRKLEKGASKSYTPSGPPQPKRSVTSTPRKSTERPEMARAPPTAPDPRSQQLGASQRTDTNATTASQTSIIQDLGEKWRKALRVIGVSRALLKKLEFEVKSQQYHEQRIPDNGSAEQLESTMQHGDSSANDNRHYTSAGI
ncbi:hypothetical protein B0H66DRAFT_594074 [Apodospora peruviana]|uniref:Uncharacterized protein n=1 Tax=Apodospora peruviana TaxID=516989 RepID=A0AAE0M1D0_9PEZI|nr:hypothetical protein B0H66DRAFT_594074 [Apodospora peruviana]